MKSKKDLNVNTRKGNPSQEHWQITVPVTARGYGNDAAGAFLPHPGKERAQPHQKINECDH